MVAKARASSLAALLLFCALLGAATSASAKELRYKDYPLDLKDGYRLVLIGFRGAVHLEAGGASAVNVMRVKKALSDKAAPGDQAALEAMNFNVRREGHQLIVEQKPSDVSVFDAAPGHALPELDYEIAAVSVPTELALREGSILVRNWKESLALQVVSGSVTTAQTEGRLRVQIQKGELHVSDHRGRVEIDSFAAKVSLRGVEGDVDLQNFSGASTLSEMTGAIELRSQSGATTIAKSSGAVDFTTLRGGLSLEDFEGPLRGTADQGNVAASLVGDVEVHIDAMQGSVNLKLPTDSGASVKLSTEDGAMSAPDTIKAVGRTKSLSGHLKGDGPKGSVVVKNKSGTSRVRI